MACIARFLTTVAVAVWLLPAAALPVFEDNFDANAVGLNTTPAGWTVSDGTVDIIGNGFFDFIPGSGAFIDLDGSVSNAGVLSRSISGLVDGTLYEVSFDLAGSHRGTTESVVVSFGSSAQTYTLASSQGWLTHTLSATASGGALLLSFDNVSADNLGALLDEVSVSAVVTAVPEPSTCALMALGLAGVAAAARRRSSPAPR